MNEVAMLTQPVGNSSVPLCTRRVSAGEKFWASFLVHCSSMRVAPRDPSAGLCRCCTSWRPPPQWP